MNQIRPKILKPNRKLRNGRGFSPDELNKAGITAADARRMKIPLDYRRKTAHSENIEAVTAHIKKITTENKPKPAPQPVTKNKKEKPKK